MTRTSRNFGRTGGYLNGPRGRNVVDHQRVLAVRQLSQRIAIAGPGGYDVGADGLSVHVDVLHARRDVLVEALAKGSS